MIDLFLIPQTAEGQDPVTGQELVSLAGKPAQINGLGFSPDGSILAAAARHGTIRLGRA